MFFMFIYSSKIKKNYYVEIYFYILYIDISVLRINVKCLVDYKVFFSTIELYIIDTSILRFFISLFFIFLSMTISSFSQV